MLPNNSDIIQNLLLSPSDLTTSALEKIMSKIMSPSIDLADIYFQASFSESWHLEDGKVKDAGFDITRGAGIRAISEDKTGFAYSDNINLHNLLDAATAARSIATHNQDKKIAINNQINAKNLNLYPNLNPLDSISEAEKIKVLSQIDKHARAQDPRVKSVEVSLGASFEAVLIMNNDGLLIPDVRPLVRLSIHVITEQNGRRESGFAGGGGRYDYKTLLDSEKHLVLAEKAVREALINLEAVDAPAGVMPVVLGAGWPGILLHEAVGHGLEGDFNRKKTSVFTDRIGEQVANPLCTIVDQGNIEKRRGSLNIDDEGVQTQETVLIENGILKGYMQDKLNAKLMGVQSTGNGRRESYASPTLPRMTNTYMRAGNHSHEEIIASVKKGIYAANFSGGQVDITSGKFVFCASEAYLIEDGKITTPVKGVTLIGDGLTALNKVSMVGNNLQLDDGMGTCGKDGQSVPVGVGQPTLKIDELTVGGTNV